MSQPSLSGTLSSIRDGYASGGERGARRKKLGGYLKAANELRQSYQSSYAPGRQLDGEKDDASDIPGAFPDVEIVRSADEEMLLFPSYARHHIKTDRPPPHEIQGVSGDLRSSSGGGDAEYWRNEWDRYEDDSAVVDVDVRGWIYAPHRGPMTRKNRLLVGLARHLSGIPATSGSSQSNSRASSPHGHRERAEARTAKHEEEMVEREARSIERRGKGEAKAASSGAYSETPGVDSDSILGLDSRSPSPASHGDVMAHREAEPPGPGFLAKRASWNNPADMSPAELSIANAHLITRLKPFLSTPLVNTPLTVFFYNDKTSRSRTVYTNEAGQFSLRAALDFVPSNVRVLASEKLSATEEVRITKPVGISLISDIDDTIKHSAIGSGAKEIFRNTFIRDLNDLAIEGVKEWYMKMAQMNVEFHYVSNSPWQLYPVLVSYFALAGLPPGSFHLKQYSGMLQGIFEPVAERKKGTLERIMRDFPNRQFILVGDSGEADLELYTDIVMANPGRILGVFIRDVTTAQNQGFFDPSMGALKKEQRSKSPQLGRQTDNASNPMPTAETDRKPILPPRNPPATTSRPSGPIMGTLIDFDEANVPSPQGPSLSSTTSYASEADRKSSVTSTRSLPPTRPSKPTSLRSQSSELSSPITSSTTESSTSTVLPTRSRPVRPVKPPRYSRPNDSQTHTSEPSLLSQSRSNPPDSIRAPSEERLGYRAAVKNSVTSAYNALPSPAAYWYGDQSPTKESRPGGDAQRTISTAASSITSKPAPPLPARRSLTSYPAAAAHYATNRFGSSWTGENNGVDDGGSNGTYATPNKKEELWKRRWARAKEIMEGRGVVLRSWRVGADVQDVAAGLVEATKKSHDSTPRRGKSSEMGNR